MQIRLAGRHQYQRFGHFQADQHVSQSGGYCFCPAPGCREMLCGPFVANQVRSRRARCSRLQNGAAEHLVHACLRDRGEPGDMGAVAVHSY